MAVHVERHRGRGVAESLAHYLHVDAGGEQQRAASVAEVVEPQTLRKLRRPHDWLEVPLHQVASIEWLANLACEDDVELAVVRFSSCRCSAFVRFTCTLCRRSSSSGFGFGPEPGLAPPLPFSATMLPSVG